MIYCGDIKFRIVTLNIWNGGVHGGSREEGLFKFAKHINILDPHIVALQEVQSGDEIIIAEHLNNLQNNSKTKQNWVAVRRYCKYADTAILSRINLTEISNDGCKTAGNGASFELNGWPIHLFSLHLNYINYGPEIIRDNPNITDAEIYETEKVRVEDIIQLFLYNNEFKTWLNKTQTTSEPLLLVGDFNTPSHEDWIEKTNKSRVIEWPTTKILTEAGFIDTFRDLYNPIEEAGITWPFNQARVNNPDEPSDRIDYIFYQGSQLIPLEAFTYPKDKTVSPEEWPSDHCALVVDFIWEQEITDYDGNGI
ncbi:hypothetical protein ACQ4LE_004067 [Meloidogyne hapla]|uniref:Endo/exonuclease/phosphatase domain-containing protein n=1 Tax=Meloidogyne hapla TaxID=6305 RepID=A0A1I8BPX2_MELHA